MIGETIGNFRVTARIGAGGMGEVFLAEQKNIETKVAIKVLRPEISVDRQHVDRFFNEARAVSRIKHAGTVKIFDVGFHSTGHAYLVMEFLEGETLSARIQRTGRLTMAQISDIGRQTAGVLEATHAAGITHRDLKPDNIFLVPDAELASRERVKILDFGIAKLTGTMSGGAAPKTQGTMGTPAYMAPEQWGDASKVDWRADIYSLGCVAFEMATGRPPFIATNFAEACGKHLGEAPPKLRSILPSAPEALETMLDAMLAKSVYGRPPLRDIARTFEQLGSGLAHGFDETLPPRPRATASQVAATVAPDAPTHAPVVHDPTPINQQPPFSPVGPTVASSPSIPKQQTTLSSAASSADVPAKKSRAGLYAIGGIVVVGGGIAAIVAASSGGSTKTAPGDAAVAVVDAAVDAAAVVTAPPDAEVKPIGAVKTELAPAFIDLGGGRSVMARQLTRSEYGLYRRNLLLDGKKDRADEAQPLKDFELTAQGLDRPDEPVAWVTHEQATALCKAIDARLPTKDEWLAASKGSWRIGTPQPGEIVLREWTSTVSGDGLATVMGGTIGGGSKMTDEQRVASLKNPLQKSTRASSGPNPPAESVASASIGIRCVRGNTIATSTTFSPATRPNPAPTTPSPLEPVRKPPGITGPGLVPRPNTTGTLATCDPTAVEQVQRKADADFSAGSWAGALVAYEMLIACKPEIARKAYLAACRAKRFPRAKQLFEQIGRPDAMAQICMKEGYDPRSKD